MSALREIADRTEGKAWQTINLSVEKREQLEKAIDGMMREAERMGEPRTREDAIAVLSLFNPEASELIN